MFSDVSVHELISVSGRNEASEEEPVGSEVR